MPPGTHTWLTAGPISVRHLPALARRGENREGIAAALWIDGAPTPHGHVRRQPLSQSEHAAA